MVNYHETLVAELTDILPTYYEYQLNSGTKTPCISYMLRNDFATATGDDIGYSRVSYQIKVWADKVSDLQLYALQIDNALRTLGWTRTSSNELFDPNSSMKQRIMVYEALFHESFIDESSLD